MSFQAKKIHMRLARKEDSDVMLEWRNHPDTRRFFFDSSAIDPEVHKTWLSAALANPSRYLLIGEDTAVKPVGVVCFDQEENVADISIYLAPQRRGEGLGIPLLDAAVKWLKENSTIEHIFADVLPTNGASLKMFAAFGFKSNLHRLSLDIRN